MRIGATKRPFYRVVVVDERKKRTGGYLELLGTYNPLTQPKEILLKQDRIDAWIKMGAQPSDGFLRIIGKAKQRAPRKPKKDKGNKSASVAEAPKTEEAKSEEMTVEASAAVETPKEEIETNEEAKELEEHKTESSLETVSEETKE